MRVVCVPRRAFRVRHPGAGQEVSACVCCWLTWLCACGEMEWVQRNPSCVLLLSAGLLCGLQPAKVRIVFLPRGTFLVSAYLSAYLCDAETRKQARARPSIVCLFALAVTGIN